MNKLLVSIPYITLSLLLSGCCLLSVPPLPEAPCSIETLLVPKDVVPMAELSDGFRDGFYETGTRSSYDPPSKIGIEKIGTSFSSEDSGGLVHDIYRFSTQKEAQDEIEQIIKYEFEDKNEVHWFTPSINPQINADKYKLACFDLRVKGVRCRLVTQYKVYFSDLDIDLIVLNYDDLKSIIEDLDYRMVSCLKP
jgi:hypothetical protein